MASLASGGIPAPSIAASTGTNPRGIKRTRTPDQRGNSHADGDRDDGMCALKLFYDAPLGVGHRGKLLSRFVSYRSCLT